MSNSYVPRAMHKVAPFLTLSYFISVIASVLLTGCATPASKTTASTRVDQKAVFQRRALLLELKRKQATIDELRDRNLVLEKRMQIQASGLVAPNQISAMEVPRPFEPSARNEIPETVESLPELPATAMLPAPTNTATATSGAVKTASGAVPVATDSNVAAEQTQYEKVLAAYAHHDKVNATKETETLIKSFPDSIFADNALYLNGLLAVENHDPARGMYYMNRVLKEYPQGNKAVAALFAKSMLEKQGQQYAAAENDFNLLNKLYPGSPESKRVAIELKTMQLLNKKREL